MAKPLDAQSGHLTNAEKEAKRLAENTIKVTNRKKITAPEWLSFEARKEFNRVVKAFEEIEGLNSLLSSLDTTTLAIYSDAFFNYVRLTKEIAEGDVVESYTNKAGATNTVINAKVQAQMKYIDVIMKCSSKLGLSLSDRLKLVIPTKDEKPQNKFSSFIK